MSFKYTRVWKELPDFNQQGEERLAEFILSQMSLALEEGHWHEIREYLLGSLMYGFSPEALESLWNLTPKWLIKPNLLEGKPPFREVLKWAVSVSPDLQKLVAGYLSSSPKDSSPSPRTNTETASPLNRPEPRLED